MRSLLLVLAALIAPLLAGDRERKHSVSIDAKVVRSGASSARSQSTNIDRVNELRSRKTVVFHRERSGQMHLEISLRNFAQAPDVVTVDWIFFAQEVGDSTPFVHSDGAEALLLKPGGSAKVLATAPAALRAESKRWEIDRLAIPGGAVEAPVSREHARAGRKLVGWLARVTADDVVLGFKASSPRFEIYAGSDQRHQIIERSAGRIGDFVR